jgi:hypothetical protein
VKGRFARRENLPGHSLSGTMARGLIAGAGAALVAGLALGAARVMVKAGRNTGPAVQSHGR